MDLRTFTLEELEQYLNPLFSSHGSTLPLSPLRLKSYLANPRADKRDTVLFEMHHENQLVGYRTLLPDKFYDREGLPQGFAWLSGNWVHPRMRRQGISTLLLNEAEEKWYGRLMYTNYAPDSKALYDHTGRFRLIARREGMRYYLRSNTEELLANRIKAGALLKMGDQVINKLREKQLTSFRFPESSSISLERIKEPAPDMEAIISLIQQDSLFRRDMNIFSWALGNPWVTDQNIPHINYHFSFSSDKFENIFFKFQDEENGARGMLWLIHHNRAISVPYLFTEDDQLMDAMASILTRTMIELGCTHTTIRHPGLNTRLEAFSKLFLSSKQMPQLVFAHNNLSDSIPPLAFIHDGDGDVMFTG